MQKQTKDQKYYRKLKEDGLKDFRKVERDNSPYPGIRVTKKQITFRVSQEAADRLKALADQAKVTQGNGQPDHPQRIPRHRGGWMGKPR